jgi:hypothetical protein
VYLPYSIFVASDWKWKSFFFRGSVKSVPRFGATGCSTNSTLNPCHHLPTSSLEHQTYP